MGDTGLIVDGLEEVNWSEDEGVDAGLVKVKIGIKDWVEEEKEDVSGEPLIVSGFGGVK